MKIMGEKVLWAEETACKSPKLEKRKKKIATLEKLRK